MKKSLLKVSFISILAIIICGSAFGVSGAPIGGGEIAPVPGGVDAPISVVIEPGKYLSSKSTNSETLCKQGFYCPGDSFMAISSQCAPTPWGMATGCFDMVDENGVPVPMSNPPYGINECPSNYDNTAEGLTSIEECCLNGYDSGTGLCIESSDPTPPRAPGRIDRNDTNPVCDETTLDTTTGPVSLEADWTANTISITWDGNGANVIGGANECTYDQSFTLPTPPTKTGYTFDGWKVVSQ